MCFMTRVLILELLDSNLYSADAQNFQGCNSKTLWSDRFHMLC